MELPAFRPRFMLIGGVVLVAALAFTLVGLAATDRSDAQAGGFTVNSTDDTVDAVPGDNVCATASGACTLRAAIMETNALPGPDAINVPSGTYTLGIEGGNEAAAATGDLDIAGDLTIDGDGIGGTVIDAAQVDRVFDVLSTELTVTISDMTLRNGRSDPNDGGAVHNDGTLTLDHVWIEHSHGDDGGAFVNLGTMTVRFSTFTDNSSNDTGGGIQNQGTLTIRNSTIQNNTAPFGAGGLNNLEGVTISESLLANNHITSGNGGGMASYEMATLANVTISGNTAGINGGGIASESGLAMTNVTITNNTANAAGGGLYTNESATSSRNVIIAGNHNDQCAGTGGYISQGNNLSSDDSCLYRAGGDRENTDPMLGTLGDNGGPTLTHALLPGSPAIDGTTTNVGCPSIDQRGVSRPQNGKCDIGAFEVAPPATPSATPTDTPIATPTSPSPPTPDPTQTTQATPTRTVPLGTPTRTATPTPGGMIGDSNCDFHVTSVDAAVILQHVAGLLGNIRCPHAADTNGDGEINSIDAALILQYSAGLLGEFPA